MTSRSRRTLLASGLIAATAALALAFSAPAYADAALAEANPADGAILDAPPTEIVLTFNEELFEDAATHVISVVDPNGGEVAVGEAVAEGNTLTIGVEAEAEGAYTVTWQAVSIDTHSISDVYQFGVGEGVVLEEDTHVTESDTRNAQIIDPTTLIVVATVGLVLALGLVTTVILLTRRARTQTED